MKHPRVVPFPCQAPSEAVYVPVGKHRLVAGAGSGRRNERPIRYFKAIDGAEYPWPAGKGAVVERDLAPSPGRSGLVICSDPRGARAR
jgi:hypothetical protein